jgi:sugar lactone lactonase YvrE
MPLGSAFHATLYMGGGGAGSAAAEGSWNINTGSYTSKTFSIVSQEAQAQAIFFKPDGTKFYAVGISSDRVYQYSMSTAWDVSTASYDTVNVLVSGQETSARGLFFKPDGTSFYMVGNGSDRVYQYSLSTAWDVSTASYASKSFLVSSQESNPQEIFFKTDGTACYIVGSGDRVYQYSLSTAWDISTASYASKSFSVATQETNPVAMFMKPDGTKFYVIGTISDKIYQYSMSTAWDVSTASYSSIDYSPGNDSPRGFFIRPDALAFFTVSLAGDVYQYSLT